MNELIVLPQTAIEIENKVLNLPVISVIDEKTNIAGNEQLKSMKIYRDEFIEALEPRRKELREPLDLFLALKKCALAVMNNQIDAQEKQIGLYGQEMIRKENERKALELTIQNELKGEDKQFQPITESRSHSEFVKGKVKEKPDASISDLAVFIQGLLDSGNIAYLKMIFDKPNISKLNAFCKLENIDGRNKEFPGLIVNMVPDVSTR